MALDTWTASLLVSKIALYIGAALAAGAILFRLSILGLTGEAAQTAIIVGIWSGIVVTALAGSAAIGLQAGLLADDGLRGIWDVEMIAIVMDGPAGNSFWLRTAGILAIAVSTALPHRAGLTIGVSGAVSVALSFGLVGHALAVDDAVLAIMVGLHFAAVAHWFGSLWPIFRSARRDSLVEAAEIADRFGRTAVWTVAVLFAAGVFSAVVLVQTPENLFNTPYGRQLILKVVVVFGIVGLGALNKLRLVPRMERGDERARHDLCRSIALEAALMVVVFAATGALTTVLALPEIPTGSASGGPWN